MVIINLMTYLFIQGHFNKILFVSPKWLKTILDTPIKNYAYIYTWGNVYYLYYLVFEKEVLMSV